MASATFSFQKSTNAQESDPIAVGAGEKVAVRLSKHDRGTSCWLKIEGNGVASLELIPDSQSNTIFDSIPEGHTVRVRANTHGKGRIEGVIESYT